jgi:copper transport protein
MIVGVALALALYPVSARAHALLLFSDPAPEGLLETPPATITLTFTEPVDPAGRGINVFSPTGHQVAAPAHPAGRALTASMTSLETGTYVVTWQVLATDTHPSRGAFRFVVGKPSANPYSRLLEDGEIGTATPLGFALQVLARWMHFLGLALTFGVIIYQRLARREPRLRRLVSAGLAVLILAEPVALVAQLASLSFDGATAIDVLASGFGRLLGLRLAVAVLLWAVLALDTFWPVLGLGAAMAVIDGASGHAIPGLPGAGLALNAVHVAAMGLWVGALVALLATAPSPPSSSGGDDRTLKYVVGAFAAIVASGLLLALPRFGFPPALLTTGYAWALVVKVILVGIALAAARLNRRRAELGIVAVVLVAAAVLISLPPPS